VSEAAIVVRGSAAHVAASLTLDGDVLRWHAPRSMTEVPTELTLPLTELRTLELVAERPSEMYKLVAGLLMVGVGLAVTWPVVGVTIIAVTLAWLGNRFLSPAMYLELVSADGARLRLKVPPASRAAARKLIGAAGKRELPDPEPERQALPAARVVPRGGSNSPGSGDPDSR
jgi:hypothetical protein